MAGEFFYVERASSAAANAEVKLNRNTNSSLYLADGIAIETLFAKFFLTNTAQAGEWIDIIIGSNFAYKKKAERNCFVDRGDAPAWDKNLAAFVTDGAWHDYDLSSIVPVGTKAITYKLLVQAPGIAGFVRFRNKDNNTLFNTTHTQPQVANVTNAVDGVIGVNSNRLIEYQITNMVWTTINFVIKGWWF